MNNKRATKRALLTSVMALVMCVVMLVGTTFAWFTDTASTGVNKIQAGNLDVKLEYKNTPTADFTEVDTSTNVFKDGALWEPGHVEYVVLKISNAGNLALKYKLGINIADEKPSINVYNNELKLSNYICFGVVDGDKSNLNRDALVAAAGEGAVLSTGYTKEDHLLAGTTDNEKIVTLVVWMPTGVGNEANHKTGVDAPTIDLGIKVDATQYTYEKDSIDDQYDKDAGYPVQVNSENIQDYLDGKYGSIDGMTLVLAAGEYGRIEFGRATAYAGSNTKYYRDGAESTPDAIKQDIAAHPNGGAGKREYVRSMSNVTLKAADNATVTINGLVAYGGQVNSTKWYSRDFVADRDMSATENNNISYWIGQRWSNITFEGLTFTGGVNIEAYGNKDTLIDNVKFDNCKFNIANNADATYCIRLNVDGNIAKANNLVVTKCDFANGLIAVLTDGMPNVTITDSIFSGLKGNVISPLMESGVPGYGRITVTGNTFKNLSSDSGRVILRMDKVGAGAVFTIKNNTATEGITLANSIKVNKLADSGITYDISGNNWGGLTASHSRLDG